jgi:hypothetical protein
MTKNKIIDIDAEFDGVEFDERSINKSTARKILSLTTDFNSKMCKVANNRDEKYQKNHQKGINRRENNIDYQLKRAEKNRNQATDPNYLKNLTIGIANRSANQKGYLICPAGIFLRQPEAANALNVAVSTIQRRIKTLPKEYYYISKEEYIMLTGKDL